MESLLTCEICMEIFDEKKRIPKVLKCGHTLCSRCLPNIGGCCLSCNWEVPTTEEEVYTNLSLFSLLGKNETSQHSEKIQNCPEDLVKLLSKKKVIEKEIEEKTRLLKEAIETEVGKSRQIESAEGCSSSIRDEDDLKNEEEPKAGALEPKSRQYPNCLLLEYFGSTKEFLSNVKRLLLQARKKVFACHRVRGHLKYGEVVFYKKEEVLTTEGWSEEYLLVMKSLSESQAEEGAAVVRFSDVQKCFTAHNPSVRIVFRDKNNKDFVFHFRPVESQLLPQLIQLCTGEKGPTYKGAKVSVIHKAMNECEVSLLNYVVDGVPTRGAVDPLASVGSRRRMNDADVPQRVKAYVEVTEEGQLRIFDGPSNKANEGRNSDGVVFYSRSYFVSSFRKGLEDVVVDCGVAIQV